MQNCKFVLSKRILTGQISFPNFVGMVKTKDELIINCLRKFIIMGDKIL